MWYIFSLDYKVKSGNAYRYFLSVENNDSNKTYSKFETVQNSNEWSNSSIIIDPYMGRKTDINTYLYAPSSGNHSAVQYDNLKLGEWQPKDICSYYIKTTEAQKYQPKGTIKWKPESLFRGRILIAGSSEELIISYPKKFSYQWHLQAESSSEEILQKKHVLIPAKTIRHYKINNYGNAWWIDVESICKQQNLCTQNEDGTYEISLVIEHDFNRYLTLGLLISGTTLLACLTYLAYDFIRRRKNKQLTTNN